MSKALRFTVNITAGSFTVKEVRTVGEELRTVYIETSTESYEVTKLAKDGKLEFYVKDDDGLFIFHGYLGDEWQPRSFDKGLNPCSTQRMALIWELAMSFTPAFSRAY